MSKEHKIFVKSLKLVSYLVLCLCFTTIHAQDKDTRIWDSPYGEDRFVIGFHLDQWLDTPDSLQIRPFSLGIDAQIMFDYTIGKSSFSWAYGYGFSSHNVHHNGYFVEKDDQGQETDEIRAWGDDYEYKTNKHSANYLEIPLELRFRTKGVNKFKLYVGGKVGYLVNFHSKIIDDDGKRKFYNYDYINKFRYGVSAKIGYNSFAISGFYSLTPLLNEGSENTLIPFSMGITYFLL